MTLMTLWKRDAIHRPAKHGSAGPKILQESCFSISKYLQLVPEKTLLRNDTNGLLLKPIKMFYLEKIVHRLELNEVGIVNKSWHYFKKKRKKKNLLHINVRYRRED